MREAESHSAMRDARKQTKMLEFHVSCGKLGRSVHDQMSGEFD